MFGKGWTKRVKVAELQESPPRFVADGQSCCEMHLRNKIDREERQRD